MTKRYFNGYFRIGLRDAEEFLIIGINAPGTHG
jgi:hypothetical protein